MTLYAKVWAIDGETDVPAQISRLMLRSATRNGNGIVEIGDLRVEELDVPATAVVVRDGAFIARGAEDVWQGSYWGYNIGDETATLTATSSAGPRSDLIWLRVEDPTSTNGGWDGDPNADPMARIVVTEGVSSGTKKIPAGKTGIPLALVTRPASTGTVLQEHIADLRQMVDGRTHSDQLTLKGTWDDSVVDSAGNVFPPDWEVFMNGADWEIDVPEWAGQIVVSYVFYGLQFINNDNNQDARGSMRVNWGGQGYDPDDYWFSHVIPNLSRVVVGGATGASGIDVPQSMRGTTQHLKIENQGASSDYHGRLQADGGSVLAVNYTFREVPRYDVPDRSAA